MGKLRPHVTSIHSNLKSPLPNGDAWTIDLAPKTLLVGSNTSHKSSVIQSVELALAGSADDIVGRNAVADAALLMTLTSTDELGISARLSDGEAALFNVSRKDGSLKKPQHVGPGESCLCYRDIRKALAGSASTARKAFLGWSASGVQRDDVLAHLDSGLHGRYQDIADHLGRGKNPVETLIAVADYSNKKARETSKEIKGADVIVEDIGANMENRPSEESVIAVKAAYEQAKSDLEQALKSDSGTGMDAVEKAEKMAEAEGAIEMWGDDATQKTRQLELARAHTPTRPEHFEMAIPLLEWATENDVEQCPACSSAVGQAHMNLCRDFYDDQVKQWEADNAASLDGVVHCLQELGIAETNLAQWWAAYRELEETPVVEPTSCISVEEARSRMDAAQKAMTSTEVAAAQWDQLVSARERLTSLHTDLDRYKNLREQCDHAIGALLGEQTESFVGRVSDYLPSDWDFSVTLKDGSREVFRMGLLRDGRLHCSLSGAEWAAVVTAIAAAVADGARPTTPAVLIPEDRAWDGKTLSAVMRAFSKFKGQVIMASTIRPTGRTPKGWTIIDMDQATERWVSRDDDDSEDQPVAMVTELPAPPVKKAKRKSTKKIRSSLEMPTSGVIVTTRSAIILEQMGYSPEDVATMTKDTAATLIADGLAPDKVVLNADGGYSMVKAGKVLPMPPAPSPEA